MNIKNIINKLNITNYELYGNDIAKINTNMNKKSKLVLVTSTSPTKYGEGKTTTVIGLVDSLNKLGINGIGTLREPSMGPIFGVKGGATGSGKAKLIPENKINLNFTGDFHAITYANDLISAIIDNHIYQGNELKIDKILFNRCIDINDRSLRKIIINNKETSFVITPASEIMSIIGLSETTSDLRNNLGNIIVGLTKDNKEIYLKDLNAVDAIMYVLEDAFKPNLVRTLYNNPIIIHTGPFANISYGTSSVRSIKMAMNLGDIVVTEAGFGSDTGGIKFFDLFGRKTNIYPDVVVINTTIRSIKYNNGYENLEYHIKNMSKFTNNIIISLNKFSDDTKEDIDNLRTYLNKYNIKLFISTMHDDGEDGCLELAKEIININNNTKKYEIYNLNDSLEVKINKIKDMFYAKEIVYNYEIKNKIKLIDKLHPNLPICISKTPTSISDNKNLLGFPKNYTMTLTDIKVYNGAGYIVLYMGNILTMPGLSKTSNYLKMKYNG